MNGRSRLDSVLEDAGMKIYPDVYFAEIGFLFYASLITVIIATAITGFWYILPIPLIVVLGGFLVPKIRAQDRASKLDVEVPFAGTYISVMATGGLSPYASLQRLKDCPLLPQLAKAVRDIEVDVQVKGYDPVSAMEKSAQHLPSRDYKDLLLGYASTLKTGGDVVHYLLIRTETMFRDLTTKVKAFGERAAVLMEGYIAISILMTLSLAIIFMVSMAFSSYWSGAFTPENFLLYSYFLVPAISIMFIYLADGQQIHEPVNEWGPYKVFLACTPILFFLLGVMFLPFIIPELSLPIAGPFVDFIVWVRTMMGLERGYEAALGLAFALIICTTPAAYAHNYYTKKGKGLEHEITNFLRDFTETRKTGASPERCMENLSGRTYGRFTKHLIIASRQIRWGLPFKTVYETFRSRIKSWLALINLYLMVDAIEVGGGTPETMETLTRFSEILSSLEKEKKAMLRPLLIMPYVGSAILLFSTVIFLGFMRTMLYSFSQQSIPFADFATLILPPLIIQAFLAGLVTGKISSTTMSTGFKHAVILVIMAVVLMMLTPYFSMPFSSFG